MRNIMAVRIYTVLAVLILLLVGAANWWQYNSFRTQKMLIAEQTKQLEAAQSRLQGIMQLAERVEELDANYAVLNCLLPTSPQENQLILELQNGTDLAGMKLLQVRFGERSECEGYTEIPINLVLQGTYIQVLDFLGYLHLCERAVRINELRLEGRDDDGISVTIAASAFFVGE